MQVLAKCPEVDKAVGRMFLGRSSPSEFAQAMRCLSALPEGLLGIQDGLANTSDLHDVMPGASIQLQSILQLACSSEVRWMGVAT
jgi:hypothetical protein